MPFYDYKCENGHVFEVMQPIMEDALTECQECGAPVQRVLHSPAVHFKGSGFYSTDYGSSKKSARGGTDTDSGSSDSSGTSDSKDKSSSDSSSGSSGSSGSDSSSSSSSSDGKGKKSESKAKASTKSD